MSNLVIRGIPVSFPYEPYELQKEYMEKVIECLQNQTNGILESPTGTGKTLSLLCASMAWLTIKKAQYLLERQVHGYDDDFLKKINDNLGKGAGNSGRKFMGLPTILYASRTHSQLAQAMQELKKTAYCDMKAIVIGSREQLCIHSDIIKEEDSTAKIHLCQAKVQTRSCHYNNNNDRILTSNSALSQLNVIDIEDLVSYGKKMTFCPYFMAKEIQTNADIVFMPYNYILDVRMRTNLGVTLTNNVLILDEGHNISQICEDSASSVITSSDIALCIAEVTDVMKALTSDTSYSSTPKDFSADELCTLKQLLLDFEKAVDQVEFKNNPEYGGTTFDGDFIFEILKRAGILYESQQAISSLVNKIVQFLSVAPEDGPFQRKGKGLENFNFLLTLVYGNPRPQFKEKIKQCYRVHIVEEESKKTTSTNWLTKLTPVKSGSKHLNFWCFNAGFGMNMLMGTDVRSVIVTSGTLAPLNALISELEIPIPVQLENPHVVKENQVCVKILDKGPDGVELNSSFRNRDNPEYLSSLGRTVLNLSRIIPSGLLIFFPSYPLMQKCQENWQMQGLWNNIYSVKKIYVEPKRKEAFNTVMSEYYSKVSDPSEKGAIFMGVCRGKISEGLDFADANGRAVLITGLPYAPFKDPRVVLKRKYLDLCKKTDKTLISGDDWYTLSATRAVNQAIGRVIRHQHDYGAIILMDSRFGNWRIKNQLSRWLRDRIEHVKFFGEVIRDLKNFYRNAEAALPPPKPFDYNSQKNNTEAVVQVPRAPSGVYDFSTSSISLASTSKMPNERRAKRKRIVISSNTQWNTDQHVPPTDCNEYIRMVKKGLTSAQFDTFIKALNTYKENLNFDDLIAQLDVVFGNQYNIRYILQGLQPYILKDHRELFEEYWERMR